MEEQLRAAIERTIDNKHYLKHAQLSGHPYLSDFETVLAAYKSHFPDEVADWLTEKMLLNPNPFQEKQFIQYACEATIVKYFSDLFPASIEIEKKVNPNNNKDVDVVFSDNGFTFHIEVKCSDYKSKELIDSSNNIKIQTVGRLTDLDKTIAALQPALDQVAEKLGLDGTTMSKNMDNNLKDFLISAHEKFNPDASDKELNILSVSVDDAEDMQLWYYYMFKDQGLFTPVSYHPQSEYDNVDLVMINNLYFKHNKYFQKKLANSWDFGNSCVLIFPNPNAKQAKNDAINHFLSICPNINQLYSAWRVPGSADEDVKDSRKIADFIKAELEDNQGTYLFEQP